MKKKHKFLVVLSCIPLLISCLILPLCSFTTTQSTDYVRLGSRSDIQFSYIYNRGGDGNYPLYNGVVPSSQQVLVSRSAQSSTALKDSINFYACDLYMGDTNKSIDIQSFNTSASYTSSLKSMLFNDEYIGDNPTYDVALAYKSDNINYSWFDLDFTIYDYHHNDDIFIELWNSTYQPLEFNATGYGPSPLPGFYLRYITGTVDVNIAVYDPTVPKFDYITLTYTGNLYDLYNANNLNPRGLDIVYIDITQIVWYILDNEDFSLGGLGIDYLISSVHFDMDFDHPLSDNSVEDRIGGIRVNSNCIYKDDIDTGYFDVIMEFLGDGRYNDGYNAGISNIDSVWPELGNFLHESVTSFMDVELFSGFTISTVLGIFVGATLLITFLKLFAGG